MINYQCKLGTHKPNLKANLMSFKDLKKQSSLGSLTQKLVKEVEKMNTTSGGADERLWKPEVDKTGNGYAVIRFYQHQREKTSLGQRCILMHFKDQVVGILKTL